MGTIYLSEYPPILYSSENTAFSNRGDVCRCYKLDLPESYSLSERDLEKIHSIWYKAFKNLPNHSIVLKTDIYRKKNYDTSHLPEKNFLQKETKRHFSGREYMAHESYLHFIYADNRSFLKSPNVKNPFKKVPKLKDIQEYKAKVDNTFNLEVNRTIEYINSTRLIKATALNEKEIDSITNEYFNGFYTDRYTQSKRNGKKYQIGDKKVGAFVINSKKQFPETLSNSIVDENISSADYSFHRGYTDGLGFDLPFDHVYNQVFFISDHQLLKRDIEIKRRNFYGARRLSAENDKASKNLEEHLEEIADDEKVKLIQAHFNLIFFAKSDEELEYNGNQVSKILKELDIKPFYPTGNNLSNIYNNSFFGNISNLNTKNIFSIDLQIALCLINNVSNYKEDKEGIDFNDRLFNIPNRKDIWDDEMALIKARNFFILAPTGEGKSVLAQHKFRQLLDQGYYLVINDLGDSYQKLSALYPKSSLYIKFRNGDPLGINPFYLPDNDLSTRAVNRRQEFCRTLWKRNESISEKEKVSLRKLIKFYYANVDRSHSFVNFYKFIEFLNVKNKIEDIIGDDAQFFDTDEFLHNCSEFMPGEVYGYLLPEKIKSLDIDIRNKNLVVFESDEAKDDPLLISVLLGMSNEVTDRLVWRDKTTRGYVFYDEVAEQLKFANVLSSLGYGYQAIRKQTAGIGIVLQSPTQLPDNEIAASIIDNTQIFYILYNEKGYDHIVKRLKLSKHDHNQLMSITNNFTGERKYSEYLLKRGKHSNIMRLELPPALQYAYLTQGDKHEKIMGLYNEYGDMQQAIKKYMSLKTA